MALVLLNACSRNPIELQTELIEASGIVRVGSELLIVSDDSEGALFRYTLKGVRFSNGNIPLQATIPIDTALHHSFTSSEASDLESIDLLPNGQIIVLSEQATALFTNEGLVAQYPETMDEIAGRGLEGLSIHASGKIIALWEGGYYSPMALQSILAGKADKFKLPQAPRFCIHTLPEGSETSVCLGKHAIKDLKVPAAPDPTQSFRAPDLVWNTDGKSIIVLLESLNAANNAFSYIWLQRFSITGEPIGAPLNLCAKGYLPQHLRDGPESNIEGLAWFDPGESLVLINDTSKMATAIVLSVNPWPKTDKTIACDG